MMMPVDFKAAITEDIKEIELALGVLNGLRDVNAARLELLKEAEARNAGGRRVNSCLRFRRLYFSILFF
jgi:hypothetical protein